MLMVGSNKPLHFFNSVDPSPSDDEDLDRSVVKRNVLTRV